MGGITAMIELNNLVVGYQGKALTPPISGHFSAGSLTAILGENGVGKSTLLKTIAQLHEPVSGDIHYGKPTSQLLSWLPQQSDIDRSFPIRVFDVAAMGCWPNTGLFNALSDTQYQRVREALYQTGIASLANNTIDTLSGGQFQRMLFARLLVQDTPVMMMDEPFVGIDSQTRAALMELITALNQSGKTIITVLHHIEVVQAFFPQLLLMKNQQVRWGETQHILPQYLHQHWTSSPRAQLSQPQQGADHEPACS